MSFFGCSHHKLTFPITLKTLTYVVCLECYRILPCTEAAALKAIENERRSNLKLIELPAKAAITAGDPPNCSMYQEDDEDQDFMNTELTPDDRILLHKMEQAFDDKAQYHHYLEEQNVLLARSCQNWIKHSKKHYRGMLGAFVLAAFWFVVSVALAFALAMRSH